MNITRSGGCLLGLGLLVGCSNVSTPKASLAPAARSGLPRSPVEVPFDLRNGQVFVQASVNGSAPQWFIVDSGAAYSEVSQAQVAALKLKPVGKVTLYGIAGKASRPRYRGVRFDLCGATFSPEFVLNEAPHPADRSHEGIIGYGLFGQFVVEINWPSRKLKLYDPQTYHYRGQGGIVPIKCEHDQPVVEGRIAGIGQAPAEARLLLDTGCSGAVCLARQYAQAHKLEEAAGTTEPGGRAGTGGNTRTRVGRLGSLQIGPFELQRPVANFFQQPVPALDSRVSPAGLAGHVGVETFRRFTTIFDVPHQRVILETNAAFAEPFIPEVTVPILIGVGRKCVLVLNGAGVSSEGPPFSVFKVETVVARSPAAEAGIKVNDVVEAVDGEAVASLTTEQLLALARQDNRAHLFTIRRGNESLKVPVRSSFPF